MAFGVLGSNYSHNTNTSIILVNLIYLSDGYFCKVTILMVIICIYETKRELQTHVVQYLTASL